MQFETSAKSVAATPPSPQTSGFSSHSGGTEKRRGVASTLLQRPQFVFPTSRFKRYQFPTHINDLVVDRAESKTSEVFMVVIEPGKAPPHHKHDDTEQVFYILEGKGTLSIGAKKKKFRVRVGDVVRIPPRTWHSIQCQGKTPLRYLAIDCFLGCRPKSEPTWDSHAKAICKQNGWDYKQTRKFQVD